MKMRKKTEPDTRTRILQIGLVAGYIGILITYVVIGFVEPTYFGFLLFFFAWLTPFLVVMIAGEVIKEERNPIFWIIAVGIAIVIGLFFGWGRFFWTEDIILGILSTALYSILVAYLVVRWISKSDQIETTTWIYILLLLVVVAGGCLITGNIIRVNVNILVGFILQIIGYVMFSVTVVYILYWLWYVTRKE